MVSLMFGEKNHMNRQARLTSRECQIAELCAWGAAKKEIASQLFISERTVENHFRNIYDKVGIQKANELSAWWFCTRFNISFSLSPFASRVIAIALLVIFTYGEIRATSDIIRPRTRVRARTERVMSRARRSAREDYRIAN